MRTRSQRNWDKTTTFCHSLQPLQVFLVFKTNILIITFFLYLLNPHYHQQYLTISPKFSGYHLDYLNNRINRHRNFGQKFRLYYKILAWLYCKFQLPQKRNLHLVLIFVIPYYLIICQLLSSPASFANISSIIDN